MAQAPRPSRKPRKVAPARMDALSVLPVFFNLTGKRVVLIGGSDAAAWKAELLAAAGAHVDVYADDVSAEMEELVEQGSSAGSLTLHVRPWSLDIFTGAACIVADAQSDDEAKALVCAARGAGVPINVIDRPAFCQFQFGSIVNRSPVVVGISTAGAAPILGQAIRRKIETLLPRSLQDWAQLAQTIRANVLDRFPVGALRRAFWEGFVTKAFSNARPLPADVEALFQNVDMAQDRQGRVTLVGAGPGDPELLTLKAVRALQAADIILFDDLVSDDILELARREAKRMLVGKRGGRQSCRQDDINGLMIKLAKQGKHVVRLKSGDPMVFGRAGEEIGALQAQAIKVDVVPGITAASAMASRLNLSLTHRDHAQCVSFMTGHSRHGVLPDAVDYADLVGPRKTGIVYMGANTAHPMTERLLQKGVSPDLPVVVMRSVARADEKEWRGVLRDLPKGCGHVAGDGPVLIGLGDVFADQALQPDQLVPDQPDQTAFGAQIG